ncbi:MAG: GDP-mannose 4,6-dehydratase [Nitrosotalea sp.]
MKILITGITGFVGSHLADYVYEKQSGVEIHGGTRWRSNLQNIKQLEGKISLHDLELRDSKSVEGVIEKVKPDKIFHLAAQSYVMTSYEAPADTLETNIIGTLNLLEAVRKVKIDPVVYVCSSSEVYGQVLPDEIPIKETNQLRPASPYAVSKVGEDRLAYQYFKSYGIKTVISRAFTHTGPRRGDVFAESSFAKQISEIENGKRDPVVMVGNLDSIRTFLDVRDIVEAYWLMTEKCDYGEVYNIGGNTTMKVGEMLEMMIKMSNKKISVKQDPARLRPSDVTLQIPDISKFVNKTGWKAKIPVEKTFRDLLDYWRETTK